MALICVANLIFLYKKILDWTFGGKFDGNDFENLEYWQVSIELYIYYL